MGEEEASKWPARSLNGDSIKASSDGKGPTLNQHRAGDVFALCPPCAGGEAAPIKINSTSSLAPNLC